MPRVVLLSWAILISIVHLKAQVKKDTVRENIDYRIGHPSKPGKVKKSIVYGDVNNRVSHTPKPAKGEKDTIRSNVNLRLNHLPNDDDVNPERQFAHYVGLQANQVVRFITGSKTQNRTLTNPYAFVYTISNRISNYGMDFGFGRESSHTLPDLFVPISEETLYSKAWQRIGIHKQRILRLRWTMRVGIDVVLSQEKKIVREYQNGFIEETNKKTQGYGLGPRASIQYLLWKKIRLGTELCWYFEHLNTTTGQKFTGLPTDYNKSNSTASTFLLPVSVFVSAKIW